MSVDDSSPQSADDRADRPAALAPDEPTAVHDVPAVSQPATDALPVPGLGEPSAAEVITSEPVPIPPSPAPALDGVDALDSSPPVTSSGLANPHGLPEIAVERPEVAIGAAFAGGLVLAMILKRFAR